MTARQKAYREFLKSEFWLELSGRVKRKAGKCRRCGSKRRLHAHHVIYRKSWYETREEDLEVLCEVCHWKEHGYRVVVDGVIPYREDWVFNVTVHRLVMLGRKMDSGRGLRRRDWSFLKKAARLYPPTESDSCIAYHVLRVARRARLEYEHLQQLESVV